MDSDWGSGFSGRVLITNNTETMIEEWTLEFDTGNVISEIWGGVIESHIGNHYVVKNPGYHQNILPAESVVIGFNVNAGNAEDGFMNFVLNQYSGREVESNVPMNFIMLQARQELNNVKEKYKYHFDMHFGMHDWMR